MAVTFNSIMTGCGVKSFDGAASFQPETIINEFCRSQWGGSGKVYDVAQKKYVEKCDLRFQDCFLLWSDLDRTTCGSQYDSQPPKKEAELSGAKFAAYIREHKLGEVVESPGRHNPLHPERIKKDKDGNDVAVGLLHVYIWAIDPIALAEWFKSHKALK